MRNRGKWGGTALQSYVSATEQKANSKLDGFVL